MNQEDFSERIMFNHSYDLLSNRWKFYIVYLLGQKNRRFGELRRCCSAVSRVSLTSYLRSLEREGFIRCEKETLPELSSVYSLTAFGCTALPAVNQLVEWGYREADS